MHWFQQLDVSQMVQNMSLHAWRSKNGAESEGKSHISYWYERILYRTWLYRCIAIKLLNKNISLFDFTVSRPSYEVWTWKLVCRLYKLLSNFCYFEFVLCVHNSCLRHFALSCPLSWINCKNFILNIIPNICRCYVLRITA